MTLVKPAHITRPIGGREVVAFHNHFDLSAWIMSTGQERLVMKGQVIDPDGQRPRDAVFAYKKGSLRRTADLIQCLYKIDLMSS